MTTNKTTPQDILVRITGKHRSRLPGGTLHLSEAFTIDLRPLDLLGGYSCLNAFTVTNAREMLRSKGYTPLNIEAQVELWIDNQLVAQAGLSEEEKQHRKIEWLISNEERDTILRTVTAHTEEREYLSGRLASLRHKKEQSPKYETLLPRLKDEYENAKRSYDRAALAKGYGVNPETLLDQIATCEERIFSKTDAAELEDLEARFSDPFY